MMVWVLTVYLLTSDRVWKQETFETEAECVRWVNFYNEYPFKPICRKEMMKVSRR